MRPLILDYAINRTGLAEPVFAYDNMLSLNTILINQVKKPFIDTTNEEILLLTKTKVIQESDDDSIALELMTKTEADREKDEEGISILELLTKTFTHKESDDEDYFNYE